MRLVALVRVLVLLLLGACAGPAALPVAAPPADAAPAPDAAPPTAWQAACLPWLEAARRVAAEHEPEFATAPIETEQRGPVQQLSISMYPPVWKTPGFHAYVERGGSLPRADAPAGWQHHAELFHGGHHATAFRTTATTHAAISFDGWTADQVRRFSPIFEAAIDHCIESD